MESKRPWRKWSEQEESDLRRVWTADGPMKQYLDLFNGRSIEAVLSHGLLMGLGARPNRNAQAGHPNASAILRVLAQGAMESVELSAKTGISRRTVMKHLKVLHAEGQVYIARWERFCESGYPARVYAIGKRKDALRPAVRTPGQKWQDRMTDLKKNRPDEYVRVMARRRANALRRAGTVKRDIAASALFGTAAA
ncbi:helix-turn-helix domain-containing protein [Burkholderia stagnalis]|uniref:helix-turn-helix domain-containing protein n=1 Tax=Burkholderia stagnalis TaxID=1503054 RepID=UPI000F56A884|nr:helix-turn-helix domain-containing protein [Burkholderia stagnalis]RQQ37084.1 transcriptional regulator [Burkholderia stagnalis]RQQ55629.1 transcriptional regulator [Burkholderia stagnalis]RQY19090.1 transcriptional regulator [Burkholderia stagnalis]RQY64225.1 transcriptional regulator [Burkholderia stagnalis]RQY70412.1 transcriptional regulator [Burkholderia stagnalis]